MPVGTLGSIGRGDDVEASCFSLVDLSGQIVVGQFLRNPSQNACNNLTKPRNRLTSFGVEGVGQVSNAKHFSGSVWIPVSVAT